MKALTCAGALALASLVPLVPVCARAEGPGDRARADALFEQGKSLRGSGQTAAACAAFEESRRLDEGIGVTLYLGDCYQALGDTPAAVGAFRKAEALAAARHDGRAAVARHRAEALESRPTPAVLAAGTPAAPAPVAETPEPAPDTTPAPPPPDDATPSRAHATRRWIGLGTASAGVVGIGIGATFGAIAISKLSRSNDGPCDATNRCTPAGLELRSASSHAATGSTIAFVAGAAALGAGLAIFFTTPRDEGVSLAPAVGANSAGAILAGRF